MTGLAEYVGSLVHMLGGSLVGKTRLQKLCYLLDTMGLGPNEKPSIAFCYHNYGPFSADVAAAADDAEALGYIRSSQARGYHQVPYTIFSAADAAPKFEDERLERRKQAAERMQAVSAIELELAATAVYLRDRGYDDFWQELQVRKPKKATSPRIEKVRKLLADLQV